MPPEPTEALEQDLQRLAKSRGWTIEQTRQRQAATDVLNRVLAHLAENHPDIYVGGIAPASPDDDPVLLVKGKADEDVRALVAQESATNILIKDAQPYSLAELKDRQWRVHDSLTTMGYRNVVTLAEIDLQGRIRANVGFEDGMPSTAEGLLSELPQTLAEQTSISFMEADAFRNEATWGGLPLWSFAVPTLFPVCTSGFTVMYGTPAARGFLTAGHCTAQLSVDSVTTPSSTYSAPWVPWYLAIGQHGDFAIHQASTTHEGRFQASPNEVRNVWSVQTGPVAVNTTVSFYSRTQFDSYDADVKADSATCSVEGSPVVKNLVLMQNTEDISSEGDSGGPWYVGYRAFGVHKGRCPVDDPDQVAYTPIRTIQQAAPDVQVPLWWWWW